MSSTKEATPNQSDLAHEEGNKIKNNNNDEPKGEEVAEIEEQLFLHNLCILPPLQKEEPTDKSQVGKDAIMLPSISPAEPVSAIRGALAEIRGYAHITNYRLVLENIDGSFHQSVVDASKTKKESEKQKEEQSNGANNNKVVNESTGEVSKKKKKKGQINGNSSSSVQISDVVSPYTSSKAVIKVPSSFLSLDNDPMSGGETEEDSNNGQDEAEIVLNDFGDLSPYVEAGQLESNMALRMVLERYDTGLVKEHVNKTRFLLEGSAPCVLRVVGNEGNEAKAGEDAKVDVYNDKSEEKEIDNETEKGPKTNPIEMLLPDFPFDKSVALNGKNLKDFYYLACGEEQRLQLLNDKVPGDFINVQKEKDEKDVHADKLKNQIIETQTIAARWSELDDMCYVNCNISFGGFNPPPSNRRILGDLAYLEVELPGKEGLVHVTAIPSGFYINRTSGDKFNPAPADEPCFSHELLDCLLQKSASLRNEWSVALKASSERSELATANDAPVESLFRAVVKRDLKTGSSDNRSTAQQQIDAVTLRPSWIDHDHEESIHRRNVPRLEENLSSTFGVELGVGVARDWNEELQSAREMTTESIEDRIERARIIHKTLNDFADASVVGAMAIFKGQISPMNPNEPSRAHVYLHNNIFFSRAIDAGVDTFKISQGDKCARKSASRDAHSVGTLHKLDVAGLNTLATVLIDYLGTRLICQSIVPGILQGEKTHDVLYGAVEATAPLEWSKEMHETLEQKLGKTLMIATRNIQRLPMTKERMEYVEARKTAPLISMIDAKQDDESSDEKKTDGVTPFFGPVEMKGIRGSDKRSYCLDITRLTARDANWVPKEQGGTANWESNYQDDKSSLVPESLFDDEWVMAILRPELVIHFTHKKMREWTEAKSAVAATKESDDNVNESSAEKTAEKEKKSDHLKKFLELSESEYKKVLCMNLNVFLPYMKGQDGLDAEDIEKIQQDEELVREAANHLWTVILPGITQDIRTGSGSSIPADGKGLTEFLHQRGVNCRYLGRLAELAKVEEEKVNEEERDVLAGKCKEIPRHKMPQCWLESLECEMVARASKHVLDRYLTLNGCVAASQPAIDIASFLSALMTRGEEKASETENRLKDEASDEEQIQLATLTFDDDSVLKRGHSEIWADIEEEVGRRFRYTLQIYNNKDNDKARRAPLIPLLRRFCQRIGIRLKAKNYKVGAKGLISSMISYPIAAQDIVEVVPLVKHAASSEEESFIPCVAGAVAASTSLHVLLPEAKNAFDAAQGCLSQKQFVSALDLIQEATNLYQRVVESPFHNRVYRCLELTSVILFQAHEYDLAIINANKAVAVAIQIGGFDSKEVLSSRSTLAHILLNTGNIASAVKQQRATMYLMEVMAGPRFVELSNSYHKLGTIYHEVGSLINSLRFYQEAFARNNPDRVIEGLLSKHSASILATLGQFKAAFETERRTYQTFRLALGEDHEFTKSSQDSMKQFMKMSIDQHKQADEEKKKHDEVIRKRLEERAAEELGNQMVADEVAAEEKKKKKKKRSNKKKK